MAKVEKITRAELVEQGLIQDAVPNSVYSKEYKKQQNASKKYYISQLKDEEIKKFFAPLGYLYHIRNEADNNSYNEPFIIVVCNEYSILFNDFTTRVYQEPSLENMGLNDDEVETTNFDISKYAELTNTTIGKLISDAIAINFLGRRFSETYPAKKKAFDENNLKRAFSNLTGEQRRFLASSKEMQEADITSRYNMNAYGMANIENKIRND